MSLLKGVNCSFEKGFFKEQDKRAKKPEDKAPSKEVFFASRLWKKRFPTAEKLTEAWYWLSDTTEKPVVTEKK